MGRAFVPDRRDWLRLAGGLLFAAGAVVLLARKGGSWSSLAVLVTLLVPTVVLLGIGFLAPVDPPVPWRPVYLITGILLVPPTLLVFIDWIGGTPGTALNVGWVFAATAAVATYAALRHATPYTTLLAALALIVSWVSVWEKILGSPSFNTFRWLLFAIGGIYVLLAYLRRADGWHRDLVTAGGVAFVSIGVISAVVVLFVSAFLVGFSSGSGSGVGSGSVGHYVDLRGSPVPSDWWTISLLVEAVGLIMYAARTGRRGPGYVGAVGLGVFALLVGLNIQALASGQSRSTVSGWPLILLIGGGALVVLSFVLRPGALDDVRIVTSRPPDEPPT